MLPVSGPFIIRPLRGGLPPLGKHHNRPVSWPHPGRTDEEAWSIMVTWQLRAAEAHSCPFLGSTSQGSRLESVLPAHPDPCSPPPTYLLILMLGHVGLELEVGTELAGAELAQVGAIDEDHLLGLQLVPLLLACCGQGLGLRGTRQGLAQPYGESQGGKSLRKAEGEPGQSHAPREGLPGHLLRAPLHSPRHLPRARGWMLYPRPCTHTQLVHTDTAIPGANVLNTYIPEELCLKSPLAGLPLGHSRPLRGC